MPSITSHDYARMRSAVFFEGAERRRTLSRFWVLLTLAAVIASAGVVADSVATVIGAMIVAPLMTPILGIVLAIVIGHRANLARSVLLVVTGAALVVALAYGLGSLIQIDVLAPSNTQVAGRVNPRVVDFLAAIATGAVGAFALVREDVADTLPGVAIAISLVPPLAVVGLTLEAGAPDQARGALLLFATNVAAILVAGVVVMALYRVYRTSAAVAAARASAGAIDETDSPVMARRYPVAMVIALAVIVVMPLVAASRRLTASSITTERVTTIAEDWVDGTEWQLASVQLREGTVVIRAIGPPPAPSPQKLRRMLDQRGHAGTDVALELVPEDHVELPGRRSGGTGARAAPR